MAGSGTPSGGRGSGRRRTGADGAVTAVELAVGVWLVASPFLLGYEDDAVVVNDVLVGLVVLALATSHALGRAPGVSWGLLLLAAWLLISPFVLALDASENQAYPERERDQVWWSHLAAGVVLSAAAVARLGLWRLRADRVRAGRGDGGRRRA